MQHMLPGRPESPGLEQTTRLAIEAAISQLISRKLLYQKVTLDLSALPEALRQAGVEVTKEALQSLEDEVSARPWELETHHKGDSPLHHSIFAAASAGSQPVGTPIHKMNLHFYAPGVQLRCPTCKGERTFIALQSSRQFNLEPPYPKSSSQGLTEQVYTVYYRCEGCRNFIHAVLIRREGMRLHLCGFAPRRLQESPRNVPKQLESILKDAVDAVAEGDLYGGLYHLRTLIEHFAKLKLEIAIDSRERGEDLLARYNKTVPVSLSSSMPSLAASYDLLSSRLHARNGSSAEEFAEQLSAVCDHIEAIALLGKYASAPAKREQT